MAHSEQSRLGKEAEVLWKAGLADQAIAKAREALAAAEAPSAEDYVTTAGFHFHHLQFSAAAELLAEGLVRHPEHPRLLLNLAGAYCRLGRFQEARQIYERMLAEGITDSSIYDGLANAFGHTGDTIRARLFGTMALNQKDKIAMAGKAPVALDRGVDPAGKRKVIAFSLFGSRPRYLRGALLNLLAARDIYPDWTCRFYADASVDEAFRTVLAEEGGEVVMDDTPSSDRRFLLTRRFLVNDDPSVGHFLVRDADSVIMPREALAVAEWLESGLAFHVMRDWFTHTDVMLAGLWGGTAGVFPDMGGAIQRFARRVPTNTNWDQHLLLAEVWPAIRDDALIHDRYFNAYRSKPFPGAMPEGGIHVGQNEYAAGKTRSGDLLSRYASRVPALGIMVKPLQVRFERRF